jgi:hypothetical protein
MGGGFTPHRYYGISYLRSAGHRAQAGVLSENLDRAQPGFVIAL